MKTNTIIVIVLVIMTLILIVWMTIDYKMEKEIREKNRICQPACVKLGWTHGKYIGENYCDCSNSIIFKIRELDVNSGGRE